MTTPSGTEDLRTAMEDLLSGDWTTFEHLLEEPAGATVLTGTSTTVRCHYLKSDPSGTPMMKILGRRLASLIMGFCTPRSEINRIRRLPDDERDEATTKAVLNARRLFTTTQEYTGEGGELLLYALLERYLRIPQILCKMSLKTNTQMQIHGSDGIHAKIEDGGVLALYWGESKILKKRSDAFHDCFVSTEPFLNQTSSEQDLHLIQTYADIGNLELREALLDYFDPDNSASAMYDPRAACLIGFPVNEYPSLPHDLASVPSIIAQIDTWRTAILSKISGFGLERFKIEVFLIPLPSEVDFRDEIRAALNG